VTGFPCTCRLEKSRREKRFNKQARRDRVDRFRNEIVSITYHGGKTLDFLVPRDDEREFFVSTLRQLCKLYQKTRPLVWNEACLLRHIWYDIDRNHNGIIEPKEFVVILNRINLYVPNAKECTRSFKRKLRPPTP